ncbi:MAG: DUF512 domain-containing protein [Firmicutes bacterium]|nr:DUF512 domain-containing protein [Bacillota bacterium]
MILTGMPEEVMMNKNIKSAKGHMVKSVQPGSPADQAGVKAGWELLRIDNQPVGDILDYRILTADERLTMLLLTDDGILRRIKLNLAGNTAPGLEFVSPAIAPLQRCSNRCLFCFVDQNPAGMRDSLYLKDDDYRLSFLYGNFITLNRLTDAEFQRIIKLQLSPLYVSVHTTNPDLRCQMFGTKKAEKGLHYLKKLTEAGIKVHAQIVLCPGYNTGSEMIRTLSDLDQLGENLLTVALVPVGLTEHREGLMPLEKFTAGEADELIRLVETMQTDYLRSKNSRFVYLADEFYGLARKPYPEEEAYEGFPQLENGVGLARIFLNELKEVSGIKPPSINHKLSVTVVTGRSAEHLLKELVKIFSEIKGLTVDLVIAENLYFGSSVTVAGLLTGSDLNSALEGNVTGDIVFISQSLLKDKSDIFLDNMSLKDLNERLNIKIVAVCGPLDLLARIDEIASNAIEAKGVTDNE